VNVNISVGTAEFEVIQTTCFAHMSEKLPAIPAILMFMHSV
jgi:hypothetical protein